MGLFKKLKEKKQKMQAQMQRGLVVTEQMRAEKKRKRMNKRMNLKPGARQAISHGLMMKKHPMEVMKEEYDRRQYKRKQKKKGGKV